MPNDFTEVVIAGAGPVGMTLALELQKHGVKFRIFDKAGERARASKAIAIHARTLEIFESMGMIEDFLECGVKVGAIHVYAKGKQVFQADFEELESPFNHIIDLPQYHTEDILCKHLEAQECAIERPVECSSFEQDEEGVRVSMCREGRGAEQVSARYLVGCDGASSAVRAGLGLNLKGNEKPKRYFLADVHLSWQHKEDSWHLYFHPDGILLFFPLGDQVWRVVATVPGNEQVEDSLEYLDRLVKSRQAHNCFFHDPLWVSTVDLCHSKVPHYRVGRVFLAGDAAHHYNPAGNQGMNTGIQDAYNLGWKLAKVIHGKAPESLLESYNAEREPVGRDVSRLTEGIARIAQLSHPLGAALRNQLMPVLAGLEMLQDRMVRKLEEIDITYRNSPITGQFVDRKWDRPVRQYFNTGPREGDRAPDGILTHAVTAEPHRIFEFLRGTHYTLLIFNTYATDRDILMEICGIARYCMEGCGGEVRPFIVSGRRIRSELKDFGEQTWLDPRHSAHESYGVKDTALFLVRPDGHVAFRSLPPRQDEFEAYLGRVLVSGA